MFLLFITKNLKIFNSNYVWLISKCCIFIACFIQPPNLDLWLFFFVFSKCLKNRCFLFNFARIGIICKTEMQVIFIWHLHYINFPRTSSIVAFLLSYVYLSFYSPIFIPLYFIWVFYFLHLSYIIYLYIFVPPIVFPLSFCSVKLY